MTWVDFIRGTGTILIIMIVAGAIAYVGDRVGHQVGRRRLSLFGIRPRYTSTIVAIGTGMLIALVVTIGAILASQQVKTAFFKLNAINTEVSELQARQRELEAKVNTGRLVVPADTLMVPFYKTIAQNDSPAERLRAIISYYSSAVQYVNANYTRLGLKPFRTPPNVADRLRAFVDDPKFQSQAEQGDVLLTVATDQNLFVDDEIHFVIESTLDTRRFVKGQPIATLQIPGGHGASVNLALSELQLYVSNAARTAHMPKYLAANVQALQVLPGATQMQEMINKPGTYYMTAYAAEDVYPHTGGMPIVIALTSSK